MIWEIILILAAAIGLVAGTLKIIESIREAKSKRVYWVFLVIVLVLAYGIYAKVNIRHQSEIEQLKSEYLIHDSGISSKLHDNYTSTYSGFLSKLSLIVGFYKRHDSLYSEEYRMYKQHYDTFKSLYDKKYINDEGIVFSGDISEIEEVVETGVNNIKSILATAKKNN